MVFGVLFVYLSYSRKLLTNFRKIFLFFGIESVTISLFLSALVNVNLNITTEKKVIGSELTLKCSSQTSSDTEISSWKFYEDDLLIIQQESDTLLKEISSLSSSFHCEAVSNWTISVNSTKVTI